MVIDATKAIESIDEIVCSMSVCINSDYCNGMRAMKDMALHAIEKQPTVDAVRVVRCRDCEYFVETNGRIGTCELTISGAEDDGFCAWGERKNDADMRGEQDE